MSDSRPADLTAQGPRAEFFAAITAELDHAYEKHGRAPWSRHEFYGILLEEVDELWAAIKGDEPQQNVMAEARQVAAMCFRYIENPDTTRGEHPPIPFRAGTRSPAPVASPERFHCPRCVEPEGSPHLPHCEEGIVVAPPAGPETGWLTMAKEEAAAMGFAPDSMAGRWFTEAVALRSALAESAQRAEERYLLWQSGVAALSAATERAEKAERGWDESRKSLWRRTEALNVANETTAAWRTRCAAALKLAGEAVEQLGRIKLGGEHLGTYDGLRQRLASLSSPSAPESGT